jgi:hypothetical protein
MMIGEIEDRILIEFGDHRHLAVTPRRFYMLPKGIAVAAGSGKRDGRQQLCLVDGYRFAAAAMTFPNGKVAGLKDWEQLIPIGQEHIHRIWNIRMDQFDVVEEIIDNDPELFMFFLQVRYHLHKRECKGKSFTFGVQSPMDEIREDTQ